MTDITPLETKTVPNEEQGWMKDTEIRPSLLDGAGNGTAQP